MNLSVFSSLAGLGSSRRFSVPVVGGGGGGFTPPYVLPTVINTSTLVGTNTPQNVRPGIFADNFAWNWANFFNYSGPVFSEKYSAGGAVVFSNHGGHSDSANVDLLIFDLADATWKFALNGNGVASATGTVAASQTSGHPYYEVTAATIAGQPAAAHTYACHVCTEDGAKGTIFQVGAAAITSDSILSGASHKQDLNTRVWSRATNDLTSAVNGGTSNDAGRGFEYSNAYDPFMRRIYVLPVGVRTGDTSIKYLRLSDNTIQTDTIGTTNASPAQTQSGTYTKGFFWRTGKLLMHFGGGATSLAALDCTNDTTRAVGWKRMTVSGALPTYGGVWCEHLGNGKLYFTDDGTTLYSLTRPSSGGDMSGTWTVATVSIGGSGFPANEFTGAPNHHTRLQYVPALDMLVWVYGSGTAAIVKV